MNEKWNPLFQALTGLIVFSLYGNFDTYTDYEYIQLELKQFDLLQQHRDELLSMLDTLDDNADPSAVTIRMSQFARENFGIILDIRDFDEGYTVRDVKYKITERVDNAVMLCNQADSLLDTAQRVKFYKAAFPVRPLNDEKLHEMENWRNRSPLNEKIKNKLKGMDNLASDLKSDKASAVIAREILTQVGYE